jgi:hypothetical protein
MFSFPIQLNPKDRRDGLLSPLRYFFLSLIASFIRFLIVVIDNIIWIAIIMALAGPMGLSGLNEAVLDWRILTLLSNHQLPSDQLPVEDVVELLVVVVSGNLLRKTPAASQNPPNNADSGVYRS